MKEFGVIFFGIILPLAFWVGVGWLIVRYFRKRKARRLEAERQLAEEQARREQQRIEEEARRQKEAEEYASALIDKYGSEVANRIVRRIPKLGDTEGVIIEMFGQPVDVDVKQTTKKTTLTYKYAQKTKSQFGVIFKFDDGQLVEWEDKR
jgi:hypothetical protein